jgi:hypothetical protein
VIVDSCLLRAGATTSAAYVETSPTPRLPALQDSVPRRIDWVGYQLMIIGEELERKSVAKSQNTLTAEK